MGILEQEPNKHIGTAIGEKYLLWKKEFGDNHNAYDKESGKLIINIFYDKEKGLFNWNVDDNQRNYHKHGLSNSYHDARFEAIDSWYNQY